MKKVNNKFNGSMFDVFANLKDAKSRDAFIGGANDAQGIVSNHAHVVAGSLNRKDARVVTPPGTAFMLRGMGFKVVVPGVATCYVGYQAEPWVVRSKVGVRAYRSGDEAISAMRAAIFVSEQQCA